ncbi:hypothetical protein BJY52DRAFT_1203993 [Lactarius psammicola]|nr:hypothetical protein BJY52DRAFT_1203993 [Lactarius psammicola]
MSPEPPVAIVSDPTLVTPNDPPPPYPSRDRRHRRRRPTVELSSADSEDVAFPGSTHTHPDENTPLLGVSSPTRRTRTMSLSSGASVSPSLAQTVVSAFRMDLDSDVEDTEETRNNHRPPADAAPPDNHLTTAPGITRRRARGCRSRWRLYFRPIGRRAYWSALLHLLVFNFFYALLAWVYLFVFTLLGTILLVALPLGAVLCFFDLLGARALARGEIALQSTFHGPLAYSLHDHEYPIFTRLRMPTPEEVRGGRSFYRNSFSMFTDPTSYQALFYFLVIKPGITILLSLLVIVVVPIALLLVVPAPAMLRLIRRLGIWQANVAVDGLYLGGG